MPLPRRLTYRFRTKRKPDLTINQILAWCDDFFDSKKRWPTRKDGTVGLPNTSWSAIDTNLSQGTRGLPRGSSLAKLLFDHRGRRHPLHLPPLTVAQILAWADSHHQRTGEWPHYTSGRIPEAPGETWSAMDHALWLGRRRLRGRSSLARLLAVHRGVRNHMALPPLTHALILKWADTHHKRTGHWPTQASGQVVGVANQKWNAIDTALIVGCRGLRGGESLARLLTDYRGVRNHMAVADLTVEQILVWVEAHRKRTGRWPTARCGPISDAPGETWLAVETALAAGKRGLPGGDSISRLLVRQRGWRNKQALPALSVKQIRGWVMAFHLQTGKWPTRESGAVTGTPGETWCAADLGLKRGQRGLPGGSSLSKLVRECRKVAEKPFTAQAKQATSRK
jgi:hypothetical protein